MAAIDYYRRILAAWQDEVPGVSFAARLRDDA